MDKSKITKLLALSQSDNDNEALAAIRMANKLLRANNLTWETFMGQEIPKHDTGPAWAHYHGVSEKIDYILQNHPSWFNPDFIMSLKLQLRSRGKLSQKQLDALNKIYTKIFT